MSDSVKPDHPDADLVAETDLVLEYDLDAAPAKRTFDWRRARSLYLYPYTFDRRSPVYTPELEEPVPLYLLPLKPEERRIISWSELYRAHDQIWLDSGPLEIGAWRELADPRSKLAKNGRKICARIEKATGKPIEALFG